MSNNEQLRKRVEQQARRMKQAEKDRPTLISQTVRWAHWDWYSYYRLWAVPTLVAGWMAL
jgi:hypothetical protein